MSARRRARASSVPSRSSKRSRTRSATSVPKQDLDLVLDNIGLPQRTYNLAFTDGIDHRRQRRPDPDLAEGGPCADRRLRQEAAPGADRGLSRRPVLFPARRYGDPDPEFRRRLADRRADPGARPGGQPGTGARDFSSAWRRCRAWSTRICSRSSTRRSSITRSTGRGRRSLASTSPAWCQQPQYQPQLLRAGHAQFLDRYGSRAFPIISPCRRRSIGSAMSTS